MTEEYTAKIRPDKVEAVEEIRGDLERAGTVMLTEYRGLSVSELHELRDSLRGVEVRYRVVKNTLARLAARDLGFEELDELFTGPTALAYCFGDPVMGAKALTGFAEDHPALVIKGGVLEGRIISADEAEGLAKIDPLETSLGKMTATLTSALHAMVITLESGLRSITSSLKQLADAGESGPLGTGAEAVEEPPAEPPAEEGEPEAAEEPAEEPEAEAEAEPEAEAEAEAEAPEEPEAEAEEQPEEPAEADGGGDENEEAGDEDEEKEGA